MQIKSITLGSYRRAKQCIAEIENQKDAKRHLKNELEKNNMIDQDAKETIKREINFLGDNIERFKMELRRIEKNAFGLDWVGTFPEDDVIDANDYADMSEVKQKSISKKFYQNANMGYGVYFDTREQAKEAVEQIGEQRLIVDPGFEQQRTWKESR